MTLINFLQTLLVLMLIICGSFASAQNQNVIDKGRAAEIAQQSFGGKLFGKIKKIDMPDGGVMYEVRLDDNGRMTIVYVDGKGNIQQKQ